MTEIIEEAVRVFNEGQRTSRSIEKTFRSSDQDPWVDCKSELKAHLDSLSKLSLYKNKLESCTPGKLPGDNDVYD
jgi:hypothetical protein